MPVLPARSNGAGNSPIKCFIVLSLSILFGAMMPLWFEGQRILPDFHLHPYDYAYSTTTTAGLLTL